MISPLPGEWIRLEAGFIILQGATVRDSPPQTVTDCHRQAIDRLPGSRRRPATVCRRPVTVCRRPATTSHGPAYVYG